MSGLQLDLHIMGATDNLDGVGSSGAGVQGQFYFAERPHANVMQQLELIYALKIPFWADFYFCHIPFYIIMRKLTLPKTISSFILVSPTLTMDFQPQSLKFGENREKIK